MCAPGLQRGGVEGEEGHRAEVSSAAFHCNTTLFQYFLPILYPPSSWNKHDHTLLIPPPAPRCMHPSLRGQWKQAKGIIAHDSAHHHNYVKNPRNLES